MISIFPEMARSPSDVVGLGYPIIDKWCTKAVLSATLNGSYTAEFTIPHKAKGVRRELLPDVKHVIKLIDMDGDEEYFRIRRFKNNLKETVITAEHISYDLIDNLIEDINNVDKDGQGIMDKISAGTQYKHPFRLTSDILKTANIRMVRMNPIQALIGTADNTFVNRLGGELKRKQFTLAMNESIGIHRTDVIRSRRNLTGFEREINLEDYATRIMPRAKNGIELPEKYVDSPHIDHDHPVIKVIDYSDVEYDGEFKDLSDSDKNRVYNELRACAKADFAAGRDVPNASYEVNFITLSNTVEYADYRALENYNLGDTVSIYEADYDVEIEAKVISFEWDVLKKRYTSMKLGSFKNGIVRSNFNKTNSVDAKISQAQYTADIALLSADGKTTNFYGTGEPVNPKKGDTWFKKNGSEEEVWQYQEVDGVMMWVYVTGTRYANALKESIAHDLSEITQQITEQQQAHDRTVAEILSQVDSTQSLAEQAKAIGDQAKADAVNLASQLSTAKTALQNSINDTKSQIATVNQALSTAKSDLQTQVKDADAKAVQAQRDITQAKSDLQSQATQLNAQAAKQVELTKLTTDTKKLADGTLTTLNELSKTVDKNTGAITSVTNRTKVVEDDLSGTKTKLEQVKTTADTTSRKTAEIQAKVDGVTERFENLRVGGRNYINDYSFEKSYTFNNNTSVWKYERIADATARSGYHIKATCTQAGGGGFHKVLCDLRSAEWQGRIMTYAVDIKASKSVRMMLGVEAFKTGYKTIDVTTNWQRFVSTDVVNFKTWYSFPFYTDGEAWSVGDIVYIRDPQLEDGNVATTPHAAEEDFSSQIAEYKRTAEQNYSGLQSTVQTLDGKVTQNKTEANQTAEVFRTKLTSLESYKDAEGSRAQAYFEAAKSETAKQITAERTAIANNYVSKSTYTEDAAGVTRRLSATEAVANNVTTRLATYQETNDRRVAALETAKISTDGTLTQLSNKVEQNAQQTRETISEIKSNLIIDGANSNLWIQSRTTGGFVTEALPANHVTGQRTCYKLANNTEITFNIEPDFSDRLYRKVTFSAWVKYENVVQGDNNWNKFNCFKHVLFRKNNKTGTVSTTDYLTLAGFEGTSDWKRITYTYDYSANTSYNQLKTSIKFNVESVRSGTAWVTGIKIELGDKATPYNLATEDVTNEFSNAKLDITKTAEGLKLAATKTELTNAQSSLQSGINAAKSAAESAQAKANSNASTITQHATQITALNNELSAKVSNTDYNTLTGRMTSAETTIQAQAGEISKRLTSTQVESAITAKGYQTKAQVDSNIDGRELAKTSDLSNYVKTTTYNNQVTETAKEYTRLISETKALIPTSFGGANLLLNGQFKDGLENWTRNYASSGTFDTDNHSSTNMQQSGLHFFGNESRVSWFGVQQSVRFNLNKGDIVTVSVSATSDGAESGLNIGVHLKQNGEILAQSWKTFSRSEMIYRKYKRFYLTFTVPNHVEYIDQLNFMFFCENGKTCNLYITDVKAAVSPIGSDYSPAISELTTVTAFNKVSDTVDRHAQTLKDQEGRINTVLQTATTAYQLLQSGGSIYEDLKTVKGQIQQVRDANYATRIETLAGSWAVKNLTSGGQILNQINLLANGINHIDGRLTHITGDTLIDRGVIKSAMIGNGQIGTAQIGTIDASQANIININAKNISTVGLTADVIKGGTLNSLNGNTKFSLDTGNLLFLNNGGYIARENGGVVSKITTGVTSSEQSVGLYVYEGNASDIAVATMNDSSYIVVSRGSDLMSCSILTKATRYYFSPPKVNSKIGDSISINFHYNQNPASTSSSVTTMIDAYSYTGKTVLSINDITLGHFTGVKDIIQKLCDKAGIMWI